MNRTSKLAIIGLTSAILWTSAPVFAQQQDKTVYATVLDRTPIMEQVQIAEPRRVCSQQQVVSQNAKSYTPSIVGGVVGAALGREFGHGKGQTLATLGVAAIGASVGRDYQNKKPKDTRLFKKCVTMRRATAMKNASPVGA